MTTKLIKVAALMVLAAALSAPVASAMRFDPPGAFSNQQSAVASVANAVYVIGCKNGTIPGATGGDNNNYDYYGDPCNSHAPSTGNLLGVTLGIPAPVATSKVCGDNDNYDYYGSACSN